MAAAALSSIKEAQEMLAARGCILNFKRVRNIVKRFATRARECQKNGNFLEEPVDVSGHRVVISVDGGRIRIRKDKKRLKTKKGRRRFHTNWKEPKLFIIYIVNEEGGMDRRFCPLIDASMNGPDNIFALLQFYVGKMNICMASSCAFIADGASWIWKRAATLMHKLGLKKDKIHLAIDFYHAAEHLWRLLELKKMSKPERKTYFKKYRRMLLKGNGIEFFEIIKSLTKGSRSKKIIREKNYFIKNESKMQYSVLTSLQLPKGSGAVESAIRRIINLRLKGPGIFWHEDSANEMLMLRSYYKANRWGIIKNMALSPSKMGIY